MTTSLSITIPEVVLRGTFLSKIRHSKTLQADTVEFDRFREDDPHRNIKWLMDSIDRILSRDRMEIAMQVDYERRN